MIIIFKRIWNERHPDSKITANEPYDIWNLLKLYEFYL